MHNYGLRFSATLALPGPMGYVALAGIVKNIVDENNNQQQDADRHLHFVDMLSLIDSERQWVGVSAPALHGMLLICEPNSSEYGILGDTHYTEVHLAHMHTNSLGKPLEWRVEQRVFEGLQLLGHGLLGAAAVPA